MCTLAVEVYKRTLNDVRGEIIHVCLLASRTLKADDARSIYNRTNFKAMKINAAMVCSSLIYLEPTN